MIQRFRGNNIGQLLLERCRKLAETRGCNMLYAQVLPNDVAYWEKQGWRRLVAEEAAARAKRIVAMVRAVDPSKPLPDVEAPEVDRAAPRAAARCVRPAARHRIELRLDAAYATTVTWSQLPCSGRVTD